MSDTTMPNQALMMQPAKMKNQALIIEPAIEPAQISPQKFNTSSLVNIKLMPSQSRLGNKLLGKMKNQVHALESELGTRNRELASQQSKEAKQEEHIRVQLDALERVVNSPATLMRSTSQIRSSSYQKKTLSLPQSMQRHLSNQDTMRKLLKSSQGYNSALVQSQQSIMNNSRIVSNNSRVDTSRSVGRSRNFATMEKSRSHNSKSQEPLASGDFRASQNRSAMQQTPAKGGTGLMRSPSFPTRLDDQIIPILSTLDPQEASPPEKAVSTFKLTEPNAIKPLGLQVKVPKRKSLVITVGCMKPDLMPSTVSVTSIPVITPEDGQNELANIVTNTSGRLVKSTEVQLEQIPEKTKRKKSRNKNSQSPVHTEQELRNGNNNMDIWRYGRHKPSEEEKQTMKHKETWDRIALEKNQLKHQKFKSCENLQKKPTRMIFNLKNDQQKAPRPRPHKLKTNILKHASFNRQPMVQSTSSLEIQGLQGQFESRQNNEEALQTTVSALKKKDSLKVTPSFVVGLPRVRFESFTKKKVLGETPSRSIQPTSDDEVHLDYPEPMQPRRKSQFFVSKSDQRATETRKKQKKRVSLALECLDEGFQKPQKAILPSTIAQTVDKRNEVQDRAKTAPFLVPARAQKKKHASSIDRSVPTTSRVSTVPNSAKKLLDDFPVTQEVSSTVISNPFEAAIKVLSRASGLKAAKTGITDPMMRSLTPATAKSSLVTKNQSGKGNSLSQHQAAMSSSIVPTPVKPETLGASIFSQQQRKFKRVCQQFSTVSLPLNNGDYVPRNSLPAKNESKKKTVMLIEPSQRLIKSNLVSPRGDAESSRTGTTITMYSPRTFRDAGDQALTSEKIQAAANAAQLQPTASGVQQEEKEQQTKPREVQILGSTYKKILQHRASFPSEPDELEQPQGFREKEQKLQNSFIMKKQLAITQNDQEFSPEQEEHTVERQTTAPKISNFLKRYMQSNNTDEKIGEKQYAKPQIYSSSRKLLSSNQQMQPFNTQKIVIEDSLYLSESQNKSQGTALGTLRGTEVGTLKIMNQAIDSNDISKESETISNEDLAPSNLLNALRAKQMNKVDRVKVSILQRGSVNCDTTSLSQLLTPQNSSNLASKFEPLSNIALKKAQKEKKYKIPKVVTSALLEQQVQIHAAKKQQNILSLDGESAAIVGKSTFARKCSTDLWNPAIPVKSPLIGVTSMDSDGPASQVSERRSRRENKAWVGQPKMVPKAPKEHVFDMAATLKPEYLEFIENSPLNEKVCQSSRPKTKSKRRSLRKVQSQEANHLHEHELASKNTPMMIMKSQNQTQKNWKHSLSTLKKIKESHKMFRKRNPSMIDNIGGQNRPAMKSAETLLDLKDNLIQTGKNEFSAKEAAIFKTQMSKELFVVNKKEFRQKRFIRAQPPRICIPRDHGENTHFKYVAKDVRSTQFGTFAKQEVTRFCTEHPDQDLPYKQKLGDPGIPSDFDQKRRGSSQGSFGKGVVPKDNRTYQMRPSVVPEFCFTKRDSDVMADDESNNPKEDEVKKNEICCRPNLIKANCPRPHHKKTQEIQEEETYPEEHQPIDVNVEIIDMIKEMQRTRPDLLTQIFADSQTNMATARWSEMLVPDSHLFNYIEKSFKDRQDRESARRKLLNIEEPKLADELQKYPTLQSSSTENNFNSFFNNQSNHLKIPIADKNHRKQLKILVEQMLTNQGRMQLMRKAFSQRSIHSQSMVSEASNRDQKSEQGE